MKRQKPSSIQRLLKEAGERINLVWSLSEISDFEVLYMDMIEIVYQRGHSRVKLITIVDYASKLVAGPAVSVTADTELALAAWEKAKATLKRFWHKLYHAIIHHDQDGVHRGHGWFNQVMVKDNLRISFSENGVKKNIPIEAFNGRSKE